MQAVQFTAKSWIPARKIVQDALAERKQVHASGEVLLLKQYTIWKVFNGRVDRSDQRPNLLA